MNVNVNWLLIVRIQMKKITVDVRYPHKYEEATEVVDLLLSNEDYLD